MGQSARVGAASNHSFGSALWILAAATLALGCGSGADSRGSADQPLGTATGTFATMHATESDEAFRAALERTGQSLDDLDAGVAISAMLDFYRSTRADGVEALGDGGDMLLFQWGSYGDGAFTYDITRQFILRDVEDADEAIWQLSLTLYFPTGPQSQAAGNGDRWCDDPDGVEGFEQFIESSPATVYARTAVPERIELRLSPAG